MQDKFTPEEKEFAYKVQNSLRGGLIPKWDPRTFESIYMIFESLDFINLSVSSTKRSVLMNVYEYIELHEVPHILIHNHPSNLMYPSPRDWDSDRWCSELHESALMFSMITDTHFNKMLIFHYGKCIYQLR